MKFRNYYLPALFVAILLSGAKVYGDVWSGIELSIAIQRSFAVFIPFHLMGFIVILGMSIDRKIYTKSFAEFRIGLFWFGIVFIIIYSIYKYIELFYLADIMIYIYISFITLPFFALWENRNNEKSLNKAKLNRWND